jgi:hypothetical protein
MINQLYLRARHVFLTHCNNAAKKSNRTEVIFMKKSKQTVNDGSIRKDSNKKVSPPQPFFDGRSVRTRYISKKVIV